MNLHEFVRDVPDFPKPGIVFKDISPLLSDRRALAAAVDALDERVADLGIDHVVGIESRGFLFAVPLALRRGTGFTPVRKPRKLPWKTRSVEYELEYGTDSLEIHEDGLSAGQRVLIVDDLLATGGTAKAATMLVQGLGAEVAACVFVVELGFLAGRERLAGQSVISLIRY